MPQDLADSLDLPLAWTRVKLDLKKNRAFLSHPFEITLIESDLDTWLGELQEDLAEDRFTPSPCGRVQVPKPHGAIRPGADLCLRDQVVYSALLHRMRDEIQRAVEWGDPHRDYAYRFRDDRGHAQWFVSFFRPWKAFDRESLRLIDEGHPFVVTADIAGYYELIDLHTLRSDANSLGVNLDALQLLETCLHRWARVSRRGIPQGYSPSDILGKLYLNTVDRALSDEGLVHRRWVDDFRIFCASERDARESLMRFTDLLGSRGLVLQSAKTRIQLAAEARVRFHQVHEVLEPIHNEFMMRLINSGALARPSVTGAELDEALAELGDDHPVEVLREAFDTYFPTQGGEFNKTLLRFLLRRLGSAGDPHALETVIPFLVEYPEETDSILGYAQAVGAVDRIEAAWVDMVNTGQAPYHYQSYQVLRWRIAIDAVPVEDFLRWVRTQAFEPVRLWGNRALARALLGRCGSVADLERLREIYGTANSELERAELVCCVQRMEVGQRNAFLGHASGDGDLVSRAVRLVRAGAFA